jgi:hypothetical protein
MKNLLYVLISGMVILLSGVGAYLFFNHASVTSSTNPSNPFGFSSTTPENTPVTSAPLIPIQTVNGSTVQIPDPTIGKVPIPEGTNKYYYLTNNQERQGNNAEFDIEYGNDSSISIVLLKEPLGESRLAAEKSLKNLFPVSNSTLCSLKLTVAVPMSISSIYSGENLGLSFCPGAVQLP